MTLNKSDLKNILRALNLELKALDADKDRERIKDIKQTIENAKQGLDVACMPGKDWTPLQAYDAAVYLCQITSGLWGQVSVSIRDNPRRQRTKFLSWNQFVKFFKDNQLQGLRYEELYGPDAERYGRRQLYGLRGD